VRFPSNGAIAVGIEIVSRGRRGPALAGKAQLPDRAGIELLPPLVSRTSPSSSTRSSGFHTFDADGSPIQGYLHLTRGNTRLLAE
jgi:hypothetical protein